MRLLALDIGEVLLRTEVERIFSRERVGNSISACHGRGRTRTAVDRFNGVWLARTLLNYGVRPRTLRQEHEEGHGYGRGEFQELFRR